MLLQLKDLSCQRDDRVLFEPVNLTVAPGDCVELLGPNGAGKSTLLRTLAGLHGQYTGAFWCDNFLFQGHRVALDELLTPIENLRWFGAINRHQFTHEQMREVLAKVDMLAMALTPCQKLSQGQQRRVSMARWLLDSAKLWLLDEPYTSLDKSGQQLLNTLLAAHCDAGGVVLAATHNPLTVGHPRALQIRPHRPGEDA